AAVGGGGGRGGGAGRGGGSRVRVFERRVEPARAREREAEVHVRDGVARGRLERVGEERLRVAPGADLPPGRGAEGGEGREGERTERAARARAGREVARAPADGDREPDERQVRIAVGRRLSADLHDPGDRR